MVYALGRIRSFLQSVFIFSANNSPSLGLLFNERRMGGKTRVSQEPRNNHRKNCLKHKNNNNKVI